MPPSPERLEEMQWIFDPSIFALRERNPLVFMAASWFALRISPKVLDPDVMLFPDGVFRLTIPAKSEENGQCVSHRS